MDNVKIANVMIFVGALVCGLISNRHPLHAQTIDAPMSIEGDDKPWNRGVSLADREAARSVFLDGNKQFYLPQYTQAAANYTAAITKWKHPAFHFNLALTQLNLGRELEAHENLIQAIRHGEEPLGALSFREAKKQLEDLERRLGRIRITCPTVGAEVTIDGTLLFTGPGSYEGWIQAKTHEIAAKGADYVAQTKRLTISPGKLEMLDLRLVTQTEAVDARRRWAAWKPWAIVVAGATVTAAGGVFHALAWRNFSSFDKDFNVQSCVQRDFPNCHNRESKPPAPSNLYSRLDVGKQERTIAIGGYIAGGSLFATGIVLLYMNRPRSLEQSATSAFARHATATPVMSDDMFGILVTIYY